MGDLLKGKVAIVTGAGRGIGRSHALTLAAQGARVVVNDLGVALDGSGSDRRPADTVAAEIRAQGGEAAASYDSVATPEGAAGIIRTALDAFGRLDILVNNAGILGLLKWIWEVTDEEFDRMIKTHVYGSYYCSREATKVFRRQKWGRIINTASTAGLGWHYASAKEPRDVYYGMAKEAVVGMTRSLAYELSNFNATVNCIRPGAATRIASEHVYPQWKEKFGQAEADKRLAEFRRQAPPEACSALVAFLASDAAADVNGCIFYDAEGEIAIYRDPPYKVASVWKKGIWTVEELVDLLPRSILPGNTKVIA